MSPIGEIDLHIHTTSSSDGQHRPEEIFKMAHALGLKAIAFTDHNSVDSIGQGMVLSKDYGIELVPCFELNTTFDEMDIHVLAYFIEYKDPGLHKWLDEIKEAKLEQAKGRYKALKILGFSIDEDDFKIAAKGMIPSGATFLKTLLLNGKAAKDLKLKPYIRGERSNSPSLNFYRDYFRKGMPAFVPLEACSAGEGIRKIRDFGGLPVQAHPSDTGDERIDKFISLGLMGLEAYSSYHRPEECEHFRQMADRHGLVYTAGSDFHGKEIKPDVEMASIEGNSYDVLERLKDARKKI